MCTSTRQGQQQQAECRAGSQQALLGRYLQQLRSQIQRGIAFSLCSCLDGAYVQQLTVFLLQVLRQQGLDYATWKRDIEQQRLRMEGYSQVNF
jgi:hypothetical protein